MDLEQIKETLRGVIAVPVTPFRDDGTVDDGAYVALLHRLAGDGIRAMTPNGNTGEFYALTADEWRSITRISAETMGDRALLMPGIGYDVDSAVDMARYAERVGIPAAMIHQPLHPFQTPAGWVDYHEAIAHAAPALAFVPYLRDPTIVAGAVNELARRCPNVVAVKYAVPDPVKLAEMASGADPRRPIFVCGLAETWAPFFWPAGAAGFTSGLANVAPGLALQMFTALKNGDSAAAMESWRRIAPFERLRAEENSAYNVAVIKEALYQLGLCGRRVRPPASELPAAQRGRVAAALSQLIVKN